MEFKDGVYKEVLAVVAGNETVVKPTVEIETAMDVADALSNAIAGKDIVVTAILDGKHKTGSKHYEGNAFDMRIWIYSKSELSTLVSNLRGNLGIDYDIVLHETHLHIEYDPK